MLYFGRIDPQGKGDLQPLLLVFQKLLKRHGNNLLLLIAGGINDHHKAQLSGFATELGIETQVLIRPNPSLIEDPLYYNASDIFVSPVDTMQESFGITPLEAMASGLPVVASAWSGYRETILHEKTGFLIPTQILDHCDPLSAFSPLQSWQSDHLRFAQTVALDLESLYFALDTLIQRPQLRQEMGDCGRERVLTTYTWAKIIARAGDIWRDLFQIAQTLPHRCEPIPSLIPAQYTEHFKHYASHTFPPESRLTLTEEGSLFCRTKGRLPIYPELQSWIRPEAALVALRFIRSMSRLRQPVTLNSLTANLARKYGLEPGQAKAHLLWLIKYGYVRNCP